VNYVCLGPDEVRDEIPSIEFEFKNPDDEGSGIEVGEETA